MGEPSGLDDRPPVTRRRRVAVGALLSLFLLLVRGFAGLGRVIGAPPPSGQASHGTALRPRPWVMMAGAPQPPRMLRQAEELESRRLLAKAAPIGVAVGDPAAFPEGDAGTSDLLFTVSRAGDPVSTVEVGYTTLAGTATSGVDFEARSGTVVIPSGSPSATVAVPVIGDPIDEVDETFQLELSGFVQVLGPPVAFAMQQSFTVVANPTAVAIGDLNGDGRSDLVVPRSGQRVSVLLNTTTPGAATPSFATQQAFTVGNEPVRVSLGDVNGDGRLDLAASNTGDDTVSVLLNTTTPGAATPSFSPQQTVGVGSFPYALAFAEVNGDGRLDLASSNRFDGTVSILLNTTTPGASVPSFVSQQVFTVGLEPLSIAAGDVNGDGRLDLATANRSGGTVSVLLNTTTPGGALPSFASQQVFAVGGTTISVVLGDVTADGRPDLAAADRTGGTVSVLANTTTPGASVPSFASQQVFTVGMEPFALGLGDLNSDGRLDLAATNLLDNTASVLLNTTPPGAGSASFASQQAFVVGDLPSGVSAGDLNGDGRLDVAVANFHGSSVSVLLNETSPATGAPSFATAQAFSTGYGPVTVLAGDVNGDGRPDLVISDFGSPSEPQTVSVLVNTTSAGGAMSSLAPRQSFSVGDAPVSVAMGDLNGDGRSDLVTANRFGDSASVLLNETPPGSLTPSFAIQGAVTVGAFEVTSVALGDVNRDGRLDLALTDGSGSDVVLFHNETTPGAAVLSFAATGTAFLVGSIPAAVATGDLNGDGAVDLAVTSQGDNAVSVLLNETSPGAPVPSFASQQSFSVGSSPGDVVVGDVNGDGRPDLLVSNTADDTVSVLLDETAPGASTPSFATQQAFSAGAGPGLLALGDVNLDGRPDLAVVSAADNAVSVLLNETPTGASAPGFSSPQSFSAGTFPYGVVLADLNGDGRLDLAATSPDDNTVSVLLNTPAEITDDLGTGTILDDDPPPTVSFTGDASIGNEDAPFFFVGAELSVESGRTITVPLSFGGTATAPDDYSAGSSSLMFSPGATTASLYYFPVNDLLDEADETIVATMDTPTNATVGAIGAHTTTILDDDPPPTVSFTAGSQSADEGDGDLTVTAQLSTVSGQDVTIPLLFSGSASLPADYTASPASELIVPAGMTSADLTLSLVDDGTDEPDETIVVTVGMPANATVGTFGQHTVTVSDDDPPPAVEFAQAVSSGAEGKVVNVELRLSAASAKEITVPFTLAGGTASNLSDFTLLGEQVVIPAGASSGSFGVMLTDDGPGDDGETVMLELETPTNATLGGITTHTLRIDEPIFTDGFESGDTSAWSSSVGSSLRIGSDEDDE